MKNRNNNDRVRDVCWNDFGGAMHRWYRGLKTEMLLVLIISACAAMVLYYVGDKVGTYFVNTYVEESDYVRQHNKALMDELQTMTEKQQLTINDVEQMLDWADEKTSIYIAVGVYQGDKNLLEGSGMDKESFVIMEDYAERDIELYDGETVTVYVYGYYDFVMYDILDNVLICASSVLFATIFLLLLQTKIRYILQLEREVKILEGGGLEHELTVKGHDELASLATGLNKMRIALKENIEKEDEATQANYDLVVRVSHDLRTPLTALMLYLDILNKNQDFTKKQQDYIDRSRKKAAQIKKMTDDLFERFLISSDSKVSIEKPQNAQFMLEDTLSDFIGNLMDNGFEVNCQLCWADARVQISTDYINRIIDNIGSNILKYADRTKPITLTVQGESSELLIRLENEISELLPDYRPESTRVGVQNITIMMERMNGHCNVERTDTHYAIELRFPIG